MSMWSRLGRRLRRSRKSRRLGESDAPADLGTARTRATGGVTDPRAPDRHSTTGTTPSEGFVGRAGGDDAGVEQTTGAERRREAGERDDGSG